MNTTISMFVSETQNLSGKLTKEHMHRLFQNLFPGGDTMPFINAIFRIFCNKSHQEEFLDFREFLSAMNVTTLRSEEEKLKVGKLIIFGKAPLFRLIQSSHFFGHLDKYNKVLSFPPTRQRSGTCNLLNMSQIFEFCYGTAVAKIAP